MSTVEKAAAIAPSRPVLPPELKGGLPYLGHAIAFNRAPLALLDRGRRKLGDVFSFLLLGKKVMVMLGPKAHETFFRAGEDQLSAKDAYQFTVPIFGRGIAYDASPDVFSEQLGFLFPALRDDRMQTYAGLMQKEAEGYLERWGDAGEVDLLDAAQEMTTFIASRCLIGKEFRQSLSTEFSSLYHDLEGGINFFAFFKHDLPLPAHRRRDRARIRMVEIISKIIAARRQSGVEGDDFLQTLMNARYKDGSALTDDAITGLLITIIFAGQHTSAVLASWTGILLLQNPKYLPAVLKEQAEVYPEDGDGTITLDKLRRLPVLERSIQEAERMRPPLIMLMRKLLKDFEYGGYTMPAGQLAMVSPGCAHLLPDVFQNPEMYDPDRFGPGREEHKKSNYALIGFGGGKHRCIGMAFAYQQVKAIWSVLLRHFDFELAGAKYEPDYATFVVGPRQPCLVRYRRKAQSRVADQNQSQNSNQSPSQTSSQAPGHSQRIET